MLTAATKVFIYIIQLLIRLYSKYLVNITATKVYTDLYSEQQLIKAFSVRIIQHIIIKLLINDHIIISKFQILYIYIFPRISQDNSSQDEQA